MQLSNKKLKYIRRHADTDSPREIADALRIPVAEVEAVLREEGHSSPVLSAAGGGFSLPLAFAIFVAVAPFVMSRSVAEATKTPQNAYIQIGTVAFLLLLLHLRGQRQSFRLGPKVLGIATVGFLVWCTISFSWAMSIREGIERIMTYTGVALLYVVTLNIVKREFIPQLLTWIYGSAVLAACIGLGQYYELIPFNLILQTTGPASTFVNKNMACHFMVLSVPLGLYLFVRFRQLWQQLLVGLGAALMIGYVFHTYTKGAWLALFIESVAMVAIVATQWILCVTRKRRAASEASAQTDPQAPADPYPFSVNQWGVIVLSVALLAVLIFLTPSGFRNELKHAFSTVSATVAERQEYSRDEKQVQEDSVINQLKRGEKTMETSSLGVRLIVWQNTLKMWQDHLLLGVGMGNFRANYDVYARSAVIDTFWPANEWHRTHNDYLQTAVETGLIGALLLLTILVSIGRIALRALRDPREAAAVALTLGLIGLSVSCFFSFPFERTIPPMLFAIYPALLTILAGDRLKVAAAKLGMETWYGATAGGYALLLLLAWGHTHLILSDAYARQVYNAESSKNYKSVIAYGDKVLGVDPYRVRILCRMGRAYTDLGQTQKSIEVLEKVVEVFPTWYLALHNLAVAYQRQRVPEKAYYYANRALALDPVAAESLNVIGCAKLDESNIIKDGAKDGTDEEKAAAKAKADAIYVEAEGIFQQAMDLDPENHEYVYNKGLATYWQGKLDEAVELMQRAIAINPDYALPYKDLGAMFASDLGKPVKAAEMFYKALEVDPNIDGAGQLREYLTKRGIAPPGSKPKKQAPRLKPQLPGTGP